MKMMFYSMVKNIDFNPQQSMKIISIQIHHRYQIFNFFLLTLEFYLVANSPRRC
jgi:hypothetical protein